MQQQCTQRRTPGSLPDPCSAKQHGRLCHPAQPLQVFTGGAQRHSFIV
jgi:hypothetical protein